MKTHKIKLFSALTNGTRLFFGTEEVIVYLDLGACGYVVLCKIFSKFNLKISNNSYTDFNKLRMHQVTKVE